MGLTLESEDMHAVCIQLVLAPANIGRFPSVCQQAWQEGGMAKMCTSGFKQSHGLAGDRRSPIAIGQQLRQRRKEVRRDVPLPSRDPSLIHLEGVDSSLTDKDKESSSLVKATLAGRLSTRADAWTCRSNKSHRPW